MRIISQDRKISIDEFKCIIFVEKEIIKAGFDSTLVILGEYKTEQRAQEVFDEIHAAYEELPFSGNSVYRMPAE